MSVVGLALVAGGILLLFLIYRNGGTEVSA